MTPQEIQRYTEQNQKNTKHTLPTTKQVHVEQSFERVRTFQRDNSKATSINDKIMEFIMLLAMGVTAISFTTDIWTSDVSPMSMMSLTAQWVVEDFVLKKDVLHAHTACSHTATAISMAFENMFETWKHEHS